MVLCLQSDSKDPSLGPHISVSIPSMLEDLQETFKSRPLPLGGGHGGGERGRSGRGRRRRCSVVQLSLRCPSVSSASVALLSHFHNVCHLLGGRHVGHRGVLSLRGGFILHLLFLDQRRLISERLWTGTGHSTVVTGRSLWGEGSGGDLQTGSGLWWG